ncbi:MAG: GDSL-type esterase/lipase family protein [bacterium]|nr:GDSL-type esterase/lipase family protein [bacterium]
MSNKTSLAAAILMMAVSASGQTRLTCVGNSITEGAGLSNPATDAYPSQAAAMLGSGWSVKNAGVSGRTMLKLGDFPLWAENKFKQGLDFNPDTVTICLGTNDSKPYNWVYKDQFVADYEAMIDTFRSLPSHPLVYACIPPPAFSAAYDISDSVIANDIIPMIRQIAADKDCPIIDFRAPLLDRPDLLPDGIHPNIEGSGVMARTLWETMTGRTVVRVSDEDAAAGRPVAASGSVDAARYGAANLVDGDDQSFWVATGFPSQVVVDLGEVLTVDLFRVGFGSASTAGYQYSVETAVTSGVWSAAVDRSQRSDTAAVALDMTAPVQARYVRLTVTGAVYPRGDTVRVSDFRVLKENGSAHAPVFTVRRTSVTATTMKFDVNYIWPKGAPGLGMFFKQAGEDAPYTALWGFKTGADYRYRDTIRLGKKNGYFAVSFRDGVEVVSDTVWADARTTGVEESRDNSKPSRCVLAEAYPNPFNPSTMLSFETSRRTHASLAVYDVRGRFVKSLSDGSVDAGFHRAVWNGTDAAGNSVPGGVYIVRLEADGSAASRKVVLVK